MTELLDTALQTLEAARQTPRDRVGAEHEGENECHGRDEQVRVQAFRRMLGTVSTPACLKRGFDRRRLEWYR